MATIFLRDIFDSVEYDTEAKLRECPFCGEEGFMYGFSVSCGHCSTRGPYDRSTRVAKDKWNTRARTPLETELIEALEQAAMSLETLADNAGRDEYLWDGVQIRGYAHNRATVARAALAKAGAGKG
jgi:hypothetical protein